ncbi:MAG: CHAT domain-containing protein [Candidatus Eisenbacteria bacterium]|nr:CHAT domain-containing protein [Candidatus Eisenbacteria bacterium]
MIRRAALALAAAAALSGCVPDRPAIDSARDPWVADAARIDTLRSQDRIAEALGIARRMERTVAAGMQPRWRAIEAPLETGELLARLGRPAGERLLLARADRALFEARSLKAADSLSAARNRCAWALHVRDSLLGPDALSSARAALVLADIEFLLAHPSEADSFAIRAERSIRAQLGAEHPLLAEARETQGRVVKNFAGTAAFTHARDHYDSAIRLRAAAYGAAGLPVSISLQSLGNLYRMARQPRAALALLKLGLDIRRTHLTPPHDEIASLYSSIAFLHMSLGEWREAEEFSRHAIEASPADVPVGSYAVRLGLHGQMLRRLGRNSEAVRDLRAAVAIRESVWTRTSRDEASTVNSGMSLYRDLAMALAAEGQAEQAFEQFERGNSRVLLLRLGADSLGKDPWSGLLGRVQRSLPANAAMIAWLRTPGMTSDSAEPTWACVVRSSGPPRWIELTPRTVRGNQRITYREMYWWDLTATANWPLRVTDTAPVGDLARGLWREAFAPLEPLLDGADRIIVYSPDLFGGGPLSALLDDRGRWLGDRYDITYAPSALLWLREQETPPVPSRPALLVGDPAYPAAARLQPLASSASEIRAIAATLPRARQIMGAQATAGRLRDMARSGELAGYGVLHVSAHTSVNPLRALESSLLLAPDIPGDDAPSRLRASDVIDWKLTADLVCLAGCGSATGKDSPSDGQLGMQLAFLAAGARSMLVTLWPVDDHATALLMQGFYERIATATSVDHARALREAQAQLRAHTDPDGTHPYAHPAYWSAFALVGDPGWR